MARLRTSIAAANADDEFLAAHPAQLEFLHHDDSTRQSPQIPLAVSMGDVLGRQGGSAEVRAGPFACDMRHLVNQGGIPSVIFGPGSIAQAHKPDENIVVQEYLDSIQILIEFIATWCNQDAEAAL